MPTGYTPIYKIMRGSEDITDHFNDRTTMLKVTSFEGDGTGDLLDIEVDDRDWLIAYPAVGETLEVHLGYLEVGYAYMGSFEIDTVTFMGPPKSIKLHGNSVGAKSVARLPAIHSYDNKKVGDIIQDIAKRGGLTATVSQELADKVVPFRNMNVSPLHMLNQLERMYGGVAKIVDNKLSFTPKDTGQTASGNTVPIVVLGPEHFGTWSVQHTEPPAFKDVQASYFDKDTLARKFVNAARPGSFAGSGNNIAPFIIGKIFNSKNEAESAAKSQMQALVRSTGMAYLTLAKGDPWVAGQQRLLIRNMRDGINGSYVITVATHTYTKQTGIVTDIQAGPPGTGSNFESNYSSSASGYTTLNPGELVGEALKRLDNVDALLGLLSTAPTRTVITPPADPLLAIP